MKGYPYSIMITRNHNQKSSTDIIKHFQSNIWLPQAGSVSLLWSNGGLSCPIYYTFIRACVFNFALVLAFRSLTNTVILCFITFTLQIVLVSRLNSVCLDVLLQFNVIEIVS